MVEKLIINKPVALEARSVDVGSHELLHGVLSSAFKNKELKEQANLVDNFLSKLSTADQDKVESVIKSVDSKGERIYSDEYLANNPDEYLTQVSDLIQQNQITYNESVFTKLGDLITPILRTFGFRKIKFNTGDDVYNFMREYSKSVKTGELNKAIITAAGGKVKDIGFKASKQLGDSIKALVPEGTTKSEYDSTFIGCIAKPRVERPIIHGPMASGFFGIKELSISLINTPGDTNLKLLTDIVAFLLLK